MSILDVVFPQKCLVCGKSGGYMCGRCVNRVEFAKAICPMCSRPSVDGNTHFKCLTLHGLDGVVSVWIYKGVVRKSITHIKFQFSSDIAEELAKHAVEYLTRSEKYLPTDSIVVPIPLHVRRERWRGFNQSDEVGKRLAQLRKQAYCPDMLIRAQKRRPQTNTLSKEQRLSNVRGIFAINMRRKDLLTKYSTVLVIDDVWTTGATMREAGKVLKRNGAKCVWGMTIAH